MSEQSESAVLGGGCFWCLEAVFEQVRGVSAVESGYAGGETTNPTYKQVCGGGTGHAEVVRVTFDPGVITYREILEVFFAIHDPTTLNRQGADVGTQYRSAIYYQSPEQKRVAEEVMAEVNSVISEEADRLVKERNITPEMVAKLKSSGHWNDTVTTELAPLDVFYRAEDYHQGYFRNNLEQGYCQAVVAPKVVKFRKHFAAKLRS